MFSPFGSSKKKKVDEDAAAAEEELPPASPDADTVTHTNVDPTVAREKLEKKLEKAEKDLTKTKESLTKEKTAKRKLYSSLVKLANELKRTRAETESLIEAAKYADRNWYEGGMWRGPELLPGALDDVPSRTTREAVSLSDLFLDLIIVIAFTRVGVAVQQRGTIDGPILAYFAIFWFIWGKEASYSTRFDTTDLSSQLETLLTCFAVLFGSLSSTGEFQSPDGTCIMMVAAFVAVLHFLLYLRVYIWFRYSDATSELYAVKMYALFTMFMTFCETVVWMVGIFAFPEDFEYRWVIFVVGILCELRVPKAFLPNDFHAASSKRGVLFILLLGFILQGVILVATPFFEYETPSAEQYFFLGSACLLLFCIKLLYVDDSYSIDPKDHALLINRAAGFVFHFGQFVLLLSTTVLGAGLDLLTHSYLAATAALADNSKNLVCGGFSALIFTIAFIKSMHIRRVPTNPDQARWFYAAYAVQTIFLLAIVYTTAQMCFAGEGALRYLMLNEIEMLVVLSVFAFLLVAMSWLDEAVELGLYGGDESAREFRVHPFGLWWCLQADDPDIVPETAEPGLAEGRLSQLSPLLGSSVTNIMRSGGYGTSAASLNPDEESGSAGKKDRAVSFDDINRQVV